MKVIIAGGRDFEDYPRLKKICDQLFLGVEELEIVSGRARGADKLGEKYAVENNIPTKLFPADWGKYGNAAGVIRNSEMAKYADTLVAFFDGKSRGTSDMIKKAKTNNLHVVVIQY